MFILLLCPCTFGAARVPASQAAAPPSHSTLTGAAATGKKVLCLCEQDHFGHVQLYDPVDRGLQASPSGRQVGGLVFSRQEHWSGLASTGCHTFWSTVYPAAPAANPPEDLVLPEPLRPKQLPHLHTWPSQGRTQVPQGSLRSKPQWTTTCRGGNKSTVETQGQCD